MAVINYEQILNLTLDDNDAQADTVRGYLIELLAAVWQEGECFNGKRPFGNSSWEYDLYKPLIKAGHVSAKFDEDGYIDDFPRDEQRKADVLIGAAIRSLLDPASPNPEGDPMNELTASAADWVEQHLDVTLTAWQRQVVQHGLDAAAARAVNATEETRA